jgi:hypothetical protein
VETLAVRNSSSIWSGFGRALGVAGYILEKSS